jgi:uncharacterized protein
MNRFTEHGAVSWSELRTSDQAAAVAFYSDIFGWQTEEMSMPGGTYTVVKVGEEAIGGIMPMPPEAGQAPPHWGTYITVADVDVTVVQAQEKGGGVAVPASDIPGVGRFAVIQDPQGALISVIAYSDDA